MESRHYFLKFLAPNQGTLSQKTPAVVHSLQKIVIVRTKNPKNFKMLIEEEEERCGYESAFTVVFLGIILLRMLEKMIRQIWRDHQRQNDAELFDDEMNNIEMNPPVMNIGADPLQIENIHEDNTLGNTIEELDFDQYGASSHKILPLLPQDFQPIEYPNMPHATRAICQPPGGK